MHGFELNTLTVIARESYEEFAENLQREIEEETEIRFGIVEPHQFAQIPVAGNGAETADLGFEQSQSLHEHLRAQGYIDACGQIQDSLRKALRDDALELPEEFAAQRADIAAVLRKLSGRLKIENADKRRTVRPRQAVLESAEFKALWDRIKHKTTYRVTFDNEDLLERSINELRNADPIPPDPVAMAEGGHCHRSGGRRGKRDRRFGHGRTR